VQAAIDLAPSEWLYHYLLGLIQKDISQAAQARASFEKAIRLNPNAADAHNQIGSLDLQEKKMKRAIESFERAIELDPRQPAFRLNLAAAYRAAGDLERAQKQEAEFHRLSKLP
jgi:tetratricopeptide (TPR) repeat protein